MTTVTLLDPRHDPEPVYWEAWRTRSGLRANWAWPLLRAGAWTSRAPLLVAVLHQPGRATAETVAGVVTASVTGVLPSRSRFCQADGWPRPSYLHVHAPQSSAQPGWWLASDDQAERSALLHAYGKAVRQELGVRQLGFLWRQVGIEDLRLLPGRVMVRQTEPVAVLDTPFTDVEAWLAGLRRGRASDLRRTFRRLDRDTDLRVEMGPAAEYATASELLRLSRLNHEKYGAAADRFSGRCSRAWWEAAIGLAEVKVLTYRDRSGRLIGGGTILDHADHPLWLLWGSEPISDGGRPNLYFDFYRRLVQWAVSQGKQSIVLGKGKADLKSDLGARLVSQCGVLSQSYYV